MAAGNVKARGIQLIREHGPYTLKLKRGLSMKKHILLFNENRESCWQTPAREYGFQYGRQ